MTTVLITRPLEQSQQLAGQLDSVGIGSIIMPLYDFSDHQPDINIPAIFTAAAGRKLVIFTSPRAVQFGLRYLPVSIRADLEYGAVGSATCRQLEDAGLKVDWVPSSGFTSEDLLDVEGLNLTNPHLDPRLQGPGKSGIGKKSQSKKDLNKKDSGKYELGTQCSGKGAAVVMAAPGGRDVLVAGLESKGWAVSKALVYQRRIVKPAEQTVQAILKARDMICIWTSTSALVSAQKNLPANVWAKILDAPALVISERIKHHLHQLGVSDISLTDGPGNADLVQSICSFADVQFSPGG